MDNEHRPIKIKNNEIILSNGFHDVWLFNVNFDYLKKEVELAEYHFFYDGS